MVAFFVPPPPFVPTVSSVGIAHVSSATGNSKTNTCVVTKPAGGWLVGNLLIAFAQYDTAGANLHISWPSPLVEIDNDVVNGGSLADAQGVLASSPSSLTFQPVSDTAISWTVIVEEYSGVNASTPIDVHSIKNISGSKSITATAVTTTHANDWVVYGGFAYCGTNTITAISTPSTFSLRSTVFLSTVDSSGAGLGNGSWDKIVATAGSVASQTATITTAGTAANTSGAGCYVALIPA